MTSPIRSAISSSNIILLAENEDEVSPSSVTKPTSNNNKSNNNNDNTLNLFDLSSSPSIPAPSINPSTKCATCLPEGAKLDSLRIECIGNVVEEHHYPMNENIGKDDETLDCVLWSLEKSLSPGKAKERPQMMFGALTPVQAALRIVLEHSWIRLWLFEDESTIADALTSPTAMHNAYGCKQTATQYDPDPCHRGVLNTEIEQYKLMMPVFQHDGYTAGLLMIRTIKLKSSLVVRKERELKRYVSCDRTGECWCVFRRREREEIEFLWITCVNESLRLKMHISFDDRTNVQQLIGNDRVYKYGGGQRLLPERLLHHTVVLERRFCRDCDEERVAICTTSHGNIKLYDDEDVGSGDSGRGSSSVGMKLSTQCQKGRFYGRSTVTIYEPTTGRRVLHATDLISSSTAELLDADMLLNLKSEVMHECDVTVKCTKSLVSTSVRGGTPTTSTLTDASRPMEGVGTSERKTKRGRPRIPEERERIEREKEIARREKQERKRVEQARRAAIQKVKNRISAARCNRRRKAKNEATKRQLSELKVIKVDLEAEWERLVLENEQLRQAALARGELTL